MQSEDSVRQAMAQARKQQTDPGFYTDDQLKAEYQRGKRKLSEINTDYSSWAADEAPQLGFDPRSRNNPAARSQHGQSAWVSLDA
jgi:hypothetical protein